MKAGAEYYKHVDEVTSNADAWRGKRLQVHGNVVAGSIEQAKGTLLYRFKIESRAPRPPAVITATYNGLVPDTFKDGAEVVAKGTLTADNQLSVVPDGIMAKCPSKYEADKNAAARQSHADACRHVHADAARRGRKALAEGDRVRENELCSFESSRVRSGTLPGSLGIAQPVDGAQAAGAQRRVERGEEADAERRRGDRQHLARRRSAPAATR